MVNAGKTLLSSIHYSVNYNNAFWNGSQMTYGDGDGNIFIDFTKAKDVIAHELTHGVTEYSAALGYTNQAGGLNESMSDVFGSMFRQWRAKQDVTRADWLIGKEIMGPGALACGYTCRENCRRPGLARGGPVKLAADTRAKLQVERIGGLAGFGGVRTYVRSHGEVDMAALSTTEQRAVEALFQSRGTAKTAQVGDRFRYRISRTTARGVENCGGGTGKPPSRISSIWDSMASRMLASVSSAVSPAETQPGRSGE